MSPSDNRGRPALGTPSQMLIATNVSIVGPIDGQIRCTRCGAALSADESIRLELGPVCRRLAADLGAVA